MAETQTKQEDVKTSDDIREAMAHRILKDSDAGIAVSLKMDADGNGVMVGIGQFVDDGLPVEIRHTLARELHVVIEREYGTSGGGSPSPADIDDMLAELFGGRGGDGGPSLDGGEDDRMFA